MSLALEQYGTDWLQALAILRRGIDGGSITNIWDSYVAQIHRGKSHKLVRYGEPVGGLVPLEITVEHPWDALPQIERIEILTFAAAAVYFQDTYGGSVSILDHPREAFQQLCKRLGCYWENTPNIRERWRLIDFYAPAHTLPNACFETRPKCPICKQPVPTGAGAMTFANGTLYRGEELAPEFNVASLKHRNDVHEECLRYAQDVILPQVRAAREEAKKNA